MTVSNTQIRQSYLGDGSSTSFPIPFRFYLATDISVFLGTVQQNSGYSITGGVDTNGNPQLGTVVFSSPPAVSVPVQIVLNVPLTQLVNLVDGTEFPSSTLNQVNDRAFQALLRHDDRISRCIAAPDGDVSPILALPAAATRANTYPTFDSNGNLSVAQSVPSGTLSQASIGGFLNPRTPAEAVAGVTPTNYAYAPVPIADARRYCNLVVDNSTDNTSAISGMWTALANYRGTITIPYGCKFNRNTVYGSMPVGVILIDESSINTGQPPGYKNKSIIYYTNDTVSDDAQHGIVSGHHPSFRLNNTHTAGTGSATSSYHSLLFAHGYKNTNDPIDGLQMLVSKSTAGNSWRLSWVLNTAYVDAANAVPWVTATVYAANARIYTLDGGVWTTGSGGTSGVTQPNGTGPTFNDGGVTWTYQNVWSQGSTRFYFDTELGKGEIIGVTQQVWRVSTTITQGLEMGCNDSTGDMWLTDQHRGKDLVRLSTAKGWTRDGVPSLNRGSALSGATPAISNEFHTVTNVGAINMTGVTLPSGQTTGVFWMYFTNGNTTLPAANWVLKGGSNVTPAAGSLMCFLIDTGLSANPIEMQRNF